VEVSYRKLYDWFRRWGYRQKVPRPMAKKADHQAQEAWKKEAVGSLAGEGAKARGMRPCGFSQGEGGGRGGPPYSPESCEAGICGGSARWLEERRYERIEAKQAAVEEVLRRLEAEGRVSSLVEWPRIRQALNALLS
jgi:hypothetical protein